MSTIIKHREFSNYKTYSMDLAGRPLTLEVGKLAELANASVLVRYGDTVVLVCATASAKPRDVIDFFPLSVDFEEKMYSVGRIPGSFLRREGRPGEKGVLTSRVIDRPIRPLPRIYEWLASRRTYTVRFGVIALLAHYLDEKFDTHHLDRLTALPSGEYYVDMAVAWAFSVALVKHFEQTLPYFTQRRLDRRVHNKALQKGRESLRIDDARKTILQRLKY